MSVDSGAARRGAQQLNRYGCQIHLLGAGSTKNKDEDHSISIVILTVGPGNSGYGADRLNLEWAGDHSQPQRSICTTHWPVSKHTHH